MCAALLYGSGVIHHATADHDICEHEFPLHFQTLLAGSAGGPISSRRASATVPAVQSHHPPPDALARQGNLHAAVPESGLPTGAPHNQHLQVLLRESLQTVQSHQRSPEARAGQGPFHAAITDALSP